MPKGKGYGTFEKTFVTPTWGMPLMVAVPLGSRTS